MQPTPQQQAVLDAVGGETCNLAVNAVAGASKTTTAIWAAGRAGPQTGFVAFNKSIADEMRSRLNGSAQAATMHSLGCRVLHAAFDTMADEPDQRKTAKHFLERFPNLHEQGRGRWKDRMFPKRGFEAVPDLVGICKRDLLNPEDESHQQAMLNAADAQGLDLPDTATQTVQLLHAVAVVWLQTLEDRTSCDFDDMLAMPLHHGLVRQQFRTVFIDEAQDLGLAQREFCVRLGERFVMVGDPHQCQPAGTMVRVTGCDDPVPIESLKAGDHVVTFNSNGSVFSGRRTQGRKIEAVASREYTGPLFRINGSSSTPNHRWLTRFRGDLDSDLTALYLVELPDQTYRVGITQLVLSGGNGCFGPGMRARQREACKLWVLHIYPSRKEAREAEFKTSMAYRIPQLACYESSEVEWCRDLLRDGVTSDVERLLAAHNRSYEYPIWRKGDGQHIGRYSYVAHACNLLPGINELCTWKDGDPLWVPLDLQVEADWSGTVYSLQVQPTEGGRRLYVSDDVVTHNSIYAFAGADCDSFDRLKSCLSSWWTPGCRELPLTWSFRCPTSHAELAAMLVPHFETKPGAERGDVQDLDAVTAMAQLAPGDMVVCRNNAPLVSLAYRLIQAGKPVLVRGRAIGDGLRALVNKLGNSMADIEDALDEWEDKRIARLERRQAGEQALQEVRDKASCLRFLLDSVSTRDELLNRIETLFADANPDQKILLSSVHRAKGLERDRVFIWEPGLMPGSADPQETNLLYVAITRSKQSLLFVDDTVRRRFGYRQWIEKVAAGCTRRDLTERL
jgi:hypothetical protein